ncbi:MAG: hypothetical protein KGP28_03640 [Bdellovibrionales bacterium]|nr:hypothetical protein [Bdellovibrionales bacterium]
MAGIRWKSFKLYVLIFLLGGWPAAEESFPQTSQVSRKSGDARLQALLSEARGESTCGFDPLTSRHPEFEAERLRNEQKLAEAMDRNSRVASQMLLADTVVTLPVVFHVIHLGEPVGVGSNISNAQIESAITSLNQHFRKMTGTTGDGAGVDTKIQFVLAKRDPNNQPTNGIIRVNGSSIPNYPTLGIEASSGTGAVEESVKALSTWPRDKYINVWVVTEIEGNNGGGGIQGYAYFPFNSAIDGIVILHSATGTLGTVKSYTNHGKTLSHEMGHYLNLYHTFNATSSCTSETSCSAGGDRVCDTPATPLGGSCSSPQCSGTQQVENYMDYTSQSCQDMFTQGQKDRMRSALDVLRPTMLTTLGGVPLTTLDASIAPSGMPGFLCDSGFQPKASLTNLGSSTITSATVRYRIDGGAWESVSFSGSLVTGVSTIITLPAIPSLSAGNHTIEFNVNAPNGGTDQSTANNSATASFSVPSNPETINVSFTLDFYGSENTYIGSQNGVNVFTGGPFQNGSQGTVVNNYHCLAPGCYTVSVRDQFNDGQSFTTGSYRILSGAGVTLATNSGNWGSVQNHEICVGGATGGGGPTPTPSPSPVADSVPPSVTLTSPSAPVNLNASSSPTITLSATASDNVGVSRVEFYRGSVLIFTDSTAPYSLSLNTTSIGEGNYALRAKAFDAAGNSSFSASVNLLIDLTPPSGSIASPAHLSTLSGASIMLSATASDGVGIGRVEFYRNGALLGSTTTSPYQYNWDLSALPDGSHTIGIKIFDTVGNSFSPSSVNLIKGGSSSLTGAVTASFGGASIGCYTRSQITSFMSNFGCTGACNSSFDVNGDSRIDTLDLTEVMGSMCHE